MDRLVRMTRDTSIETQIPDFDWAGEHGLLAEVVRDVRYNTKTGKLYVEPVESNAFDSCIRADTAKHLLKKYMARNDQNIESWSVILRARAGIKDNIMHAVDLMHCEQLKD